jgi:UDP-N-acetylmuramate--alanine ligase
VVAGIAQRPHFAQGQAQVLYGGAVAETTRLLTDLLRSGDLVVIMGAGDIYTVTETLLKNNREQA